MFNVPKNTKSFSTAATHNGVFHADDVLAAAILMMTMPGITIRRTRDQRELDKADVVFDVGGVYDPEKGRYDHHQKGRAGQYSNGIEYSSAGLIWAAFGHLLGLEPEVEKEVLIRLIMPTDAADNGQHFVKDVPVPNFVEDGHGIQTLSFSRLISMLNPCWHEGQNDETFDSAFAMASTLVMTFIDRVVAQARGALLGAKHVEKAIEDSQRGPLVLLDRFYPWQEIVCASAPKALYIIFQGEGGLWMVNAIPPAPGSFEKRKPLPAAWGGLKEDELQELTGVLDAKFCHPGLFICGAHSKEGALKLAELAVKEAT